MSGPRRILLGVAWLLALALGSGVLAADEPAATVEPVYPHTVSGVWLRAGPGTEIASGKLSGDLVITPESLELLAGKRDVSIPFEAVRMISLGTMRGDVDTEWVVLAVLRDGKRGTIGLRDGRKLGYGGRTTELYAALRDTARRFRWAQFAAAEGFRPYTELDRVFAMSVPADWSMYHHELISDEGVIRWGTTVFTPRPLLAEDPKGKGRARAIATIQQGGTTAWIVTRREALSGMSCEGFDKGALRALGSLVVEDPFFGRPFSFAESPEFEPVEIDGCAGLRLVARGVPEAPTAAALDLRVVAREKALVLVGLRTTAADLERETARFESALSSLRLAATR